VPQSDAPPRRERGVQAAKDWLESELAVAAARNAGLGVPHAVEHDVAVCEDCARSNDYLGVKLASSRVREWSRTLPSNLRPDLRDSVSWLESVLAPRQHSLPRLRSRRHGFARRSRHGNRMARRGSRSPASSGCTDSRGGSGAAGSVARFVQGGAS
jgi:hypothetical protein